MTDKQIIETKKMKGLNEYSLKEFQEMENFHENSLFDQVIIVPMNRIHDSGYRCMKFILADHGDIVGVVSGWSDVVAPNGFYNATHLSMDCLKKSRCVRIMLDGLYKADDFIGSDFLFYKED